MPSERAPSTRTPAVFNVASLSTPSNVDTIAAAPPTSAPDTSSSQSPSSEVPKSTMIPPSIDENVEIDFGKARNPDEVVERPKPVDPKTLSDKDKHPDAIDPKNAPVGKPKPDVKFDVDSLNEDPVLDEADTPEEGEDPTNKEAAQVGTVSKRKREYTGIPEIDELLSELPNQKYEKARQLLPDLFKAREKVTELEKQLKERPPEEVKYWFDHEEAYSLDDDFRGAQRDFQQAEFERSHFEQQLARIEAGEPWHDLVGYDKQGMPQYKVVEPREDGKIDAASRARLLGMVAKYGSLQQDLQSRMHKSRSSFADGVKRGQQELQEVEQKIFPRWKDEKALTKEDSAALDLVKSLYPRHMQKHPAVKHAGMAFREFQRLAEVHGNTLKELAVLRNEVARLKGRSGKPLPTGEKLDADEDDVVDMKKLNAEFSRV